MSSFTKALTNKGLALQAKAQAGAELQYTRFVLGDGRLSNQSISTLTNVISPKKSVSVTKLKMDVPNQATVGFVLSNQDVTTGFYFRELGLYAMDPDDGEILYLYANAGDTADYIPAAGGSDVVEESFDVLTFVGQATNVTANMDSSLIYVTQADLEEALSGLNGDVIDSVTSTEREKAASANSVKITYDKAVEAQQLVTTHSNDESAHGIGDKTQLNTVSKDTIVGAINEVNEILSSYASGKDDNGKYTIIEWKRQDDTLAKKSVLSDLVGENYTVQTITWYDATGTSVVKTEIYDLTYDEDGFPISEVKR